MASLEKLVKALEALKISKELPTSVEDETALRRKKKMELCSFVADSMCSPSVKNAANFASLLSFSVETLLQLCDDSDSNIRLVADEGLNRIIRAMMDKNVVKVHVELHKEIKKNGSVRSLRAALSRFAQLAHMIRPQKGKAYIQNLTPSLIEIAKRREEPVLETLAAALPPILDALGSFTTDNNIRDLLKSFLANLSSEMAVVRRTAAASIVSICQYSRKPAVFFSYTLNSLLDIIMPLKDGEDNDTVLGVLSCVRLVLPHLMQTADSDSGLRGSFGVRQSSQDCEPSVDRLLQVYELCLHFTLHPDHNTVTTALETLHQLLQCAPPPLLEVLLSENGLTQSHIQSRFQDTGKLSHRTLSELSVASSDPLGEGADSPLLDTQEEIIQDSRLVQWVQNSTTSSQIDSASEESDADVQFVPVTPILVGSSIQRAPSLEAEALIGRDTPSPEAPELTSTHQAQVWEIGQPVQSGQIALVYCCRRLVTGFLLPDSTPGPRVRVSVKALALQCLTQLLRVHPQLFYYSIDLNNQCSTEGFCRVSDVTYFTSHSDQQLRGLTHVLIGQFIRSTLVASNTTFTQWEANVIKCIQLKDTTSKTVDLDNLLILLVSGLEDESSVCVRHSLTGIASCLGQLLVSCDHQSSIPLLQALLKTSNNTYWLVKVKLLELLGYIPYINVYYVTASSDFQNSVLNSVMLPLLGDEDVRVRKAASEAITKVVANLYHPVDENRLDIVNGQATRLSNSFLTGLFERSNDNCVEFILEGSLSRIIHLITRLLLHSSSKHFTAGCCEALSMLSVQYPPITFNRAWHTYIAKHSSDAKASPSASGLLGAVAAMLTASPSGLDLSVHNWLIVLAGNLYTGLAAMDLTRGKEFSEKSESKLWANFSDVKLANLSESLLHHLMRLLCVFVRVLEEVPATSKNPMIPSPIKRRPSRATSPAKVNSTQGEKELIKEEKGKFGQFNHIPHYNKLFENLRSAYANYKTQLECSDKLAGLLGSVLGCLGQLLEFSSLAESGRVAEEMLLYLRTAVSLEPTASVKAVQQLLKSLFGTNKIAQWEEEKERLKPPSVPAFHFTSFNETVLKRPFAQIGLPTSQHNEISFLHNKLHQGLSNHRKASSVVKGFMKGSDRQALASYIRLFEPMVIQALKQYTVSNNVQLQVSVLSLLTQLVLLKVNYCLLDSDQIFIEFVLKQFEFLEVGQIRNPEILVPKLFEFLVHLSYEKNHSKPVISVSKVIQLCDGLMASGQDPMTHCIPALAPVVEHVFTATTSVSAWQVKTQRDVVFAMLLRLVEYPQVLNLLSQILTAERSGEEAKRWSHQTADVLLPLLAQGRVRLDSADTIGSLLDLLDSFLPRTLSPPDPTLRVLFTSQLYEVEFCTRSFGTILSMLLYILSRDEEDSLLARLEDLKLCVREQSDDPLNASAANLNDPPQIVFARLLLRTLHCMATQLYSAEFSCYGNQSASQLQYLLAHFLVCCCHIQKSTTHQLIAAGFLSLVMESESAVVNELSQLFLKLRTRCPLVVVLWCTLLTLINNRDKAFWSAVMMSSENSGDSTSKRNCLNLEVVQRGSIIIFCEYIVSKTNLIDESAWLLSKHFKELLLLYNESPVSDFLEVCKNNPATSSLLLPSVATVCAVKPQPQLVNRILDYLLSASLDDSGPVLTIVSSLLTHPHMVLARRAAALACSRVEYLLILEREEVTKMLDQEDLLSLLTALTKNSRLASKYSGLVSLLNKLASTHYRISPISDQSRSVNTANIHTISLDKAWFLSQVRLRCCQVESARQCSQLLCQLGYDDMVTVLRCQQFNNNILQHCFTLGAQLTLQERKTGEGEHLSALYLAARTALLQHIHHLQSLLPRMHQVYSPVGRQPFPKEKKYTDRLNELFGDSQFLETLFRLVPAVVSFLLSLSDLAPCQQPLIPDEAREDLAKFGVLCSEVVHWLLKREGAWPSLLHSSLQCAVCILQQDQLTALLSFNQLGSVTSTLAALVHSASGNHLTLPSHPGGSTSTVSAFHSVVVEDDSNIALPKPSEGMELEEEKAAMEQETVVSLHTRYQVAALVCWLEKQPGPLSNVPQFIINSIRCMVMSVGRCGLVVWYSNNPPDTWPPEAPSQPPLPTPLLQDIDILRQVIFRISLIGWTSRTQFEETWMSLLTVLSSSPGPESDQEEIQAIMQSNSMAVQAITSLLVQTLLTPTTGKPDTGCLLHSSRDKPFQLHKEWGPKLECVVDALYWKLRESQTSIRIFRLNDRCNIERLHNCHRYGYGQVSIDFLKTAAMPPEERALEPANCVNADFLEHQKRISESGLDLHSCIQFLLDLYSQWLLPEMSTSLSLLLEVVRSTVIISDLFTERSHFAWLLDLCLVLSTSHPLEDEILHQYLVVAACKAAAVLPALETEVCNQVLRLLESSLKAVYPPTRLAAAHGLLYMLEGFIHSQVDESLSDAGKTPDTRHRLLSIAKEHISRHFTAESSSVSSEESQLVIYSLVFYIMEHSPQDLAPEVQSHLLQLVISTSSSRQIVLYQALVQGLCRLILAECVDPSSRLGSSLLESVMRLAMDRINQSDPIVSLLALKLLLTCMYCGEYTKMKGVDGIMDPEQMVVTMEKTSVLFERVKKGSPVEVESVCAVLPFLLADFFTASEVLTKVIGEFLSPQQLNHRHLSAVVFQVLSQACREQQLPLLQAWLVMSLHIFTQTLPVAMASWCLSCFFISASTNPWLRAVFPHVQTRMGKCTYEDRKLLCIAASDFYRQLNDPKQKEAFLKTFKDAASTPKSPFADILSSL